MELVLATYYVISAMISYMILKIQNPYNITSPTAINAFLFGWIILPYNVFKFFKNLKK